MDYDTIEVNELVERVKDDKVEILLISVLMLHSSFKIQRVREKLTEANLDVKIVVGGAPFRFDDELWREVGADAMCRTASDAVATVRCILGGIR